MKTRTYLILAVGLLIAFAYLPYIWGGGSFMIDDWQIRSTAFFQGSFWKTFRYWNVEGGSGMRPLASFFFALTPAIFGDNPVGYILLNTALWLASVLLFRRIVAEYCGEHVSWWFVALAAVPTIASSTIFEPVTMIIGSSNLFLWALSLALLHKYLRSGQKLFFVLSYALLICALLIYEVIAPLLLLTALLPLLHNAIHKNQNGQNQTSPKQLWNTLRGDLLTFGLPIVAVIASISVFQKLIVPLYGITLSRLSARPLGDMLRSFARWLFSVCVDTPLMLFSSLLHEGRSLFIRVEFWMLIAAVLVFVLCLRTFAQAQTSEIVRKKIVGVLTNTSLFYSMIALTLIFCSVLSVLSGINMRVEGIENRFLGSTWFMLSVLLAGAIVRFARIGAMLGGFLLVCVYWSFQIQAGNYVANRSIQEQVLNDCTTKLYAAEKRGERIDSAYIIGNVPVYANKNFNNEVVFAYRFDFGGGLRMKTNGRVEMGQVVNINKEAPANDSTRFFCAISPNQDSVLVGNLTGIMKRPINDKLWWYEYDQFTGKSSLTHITHGAPQLDSILQFSRTTMINAAPLPATERVRNGMKTLLKRKSA
ncbi:MAG: hypothetical protein EAZ92_10360 [Candidatus Kapaibacterium sp.]|nr:MAG: hypothetical protein EAZ92_10360 [Candidatus Kapabacteria bacterium]